MKSEIRNIIRGLIYEQYEISKGINVYPHFSRGAFPYSLGDTMISQPEDIDYRTQYLSNFSKHSGNHEMYEFPFDEFKLGLKIETDKSDDPILTVAFKVLTQLQTNPRFYTELSK